MTDQPPRTPEQIAEQIVREHAAPCIYDCKHNGAPLCLHCSPIAKAIASALTEARARISKLEELCKHKCECPAEGWADLVCECMKNPQ